MNAVTPMRTDYTWWTQALSGNRQELKSRTPQPGYYRDRQRAIGIWFDEETGELMCSASSGWEPSEPSEIEDLFAFACRYPIPHEVYEAVFNGGEFPPHYLVDLSLEDIKAEVAWTPAWAKARFDERQAKAKAKQDLAAREKAEADRIAEAKDVSAEVEEASAETPKIGHNSDAEPHVIARDELNAILVAFRKWFQEDVAGKIETEAASLKAKGFQDQVNAIRLDAEKKHKAEKAPHLVAGRAVDAKWITGPDSITGQAKRLEELIQKERTPFEVADKCRREEAAREAEQKRLAEEKARQAEIEAAGPVPQPLFEAIPSQAKPKGGAKKVEKKTTKTIERLVFDDPTAVFSYLAKIPAFQVDANDIATRIARRIIDNGTTVPGARKVTEEVAL